ncbi:uncharacterized protein MELLADRAFT_103910 [Melampsora larici-populina 98AG31]|uniref:Uncharacterized protein n=1 Tax=Melampsora larici-populina (strain 98AG31 / pathotype 3-4-7) TaxID=747676 RepID=F4RCY6_MELLP|nr:uncharacterized protein MELLADRAFT_103910 [Melampsora larici-populina 98AG31]EGG09806.1 hypothetical protein MELLADRAFT_103910 [Melampsora larici-populina 98AG31]
MVTEMVESLHRYGYIPLDLNTWVVTKEEARQRAAGMPTCDCSNCEPEEAEALWLAQAALTNDNFDTALKMDETELLELRASLPKAPPPAIAETRPMAILCGDDDPILGCSLLETLVTRLEQAFNEFFMSQFTGESDLAPADYFGRDMAWDLAKNVDIFLQPSDLAMVLGGEAIPGQFHCLFDTFSQWQTDLTTAPILAEAISRRQAANRVHGPAKIPQSVEGAQLAKSRSEAEQTAFKEAQILERQQKQQTKLAEKEAAQEKRAAERRVAEAHKRANQEAASAERARIKQARQMERDQQNQIKIAAKKAVQAKRAEEKLAVETQKRTKQQAASVKQARKRKMNEDVPPSRKGKKNSEHANLPTGSQSSDLPGEGSKQVGEELVGSDQSNILNSSEFSLSPDDDRTSAAPQRNRDDRPAALSARINLIKLRIPVVQTFVTMGEGRIARVSPRCSFA